MNYDCIFWDWNGTLLDDTDYCIKTVNKSIEKRGLPFLDKKRYYEIFRFPVIDYYVDLGFDFTKESYDDLAVEFNVNYVNSSNELKLRKEAKEVLEVFHGKNLSQYVLSASESKVLKDALKFYEIEKYFSAISTSDDYRASGKVERGKLFAKEVADGKKILLVGDSKHDLDSANAMGADCVLIKGGHTSDEKLSSLNVPIIDDLYGLYSIVIGTKKGSYSVSRIKTSDMERYSFDINEAEPKNFVTSYKAFYDDLKNTNKTEDW